MSLPGRSGAPRRAPPAPEEHPLTKSASPRLYASCLAVLVWMAPAVVRAQGQAAVPDAAVPGRERVEPVPAVPVHQEPHHRQLFQRGPMRILELQLPPGDISWFHLHDWPVLYISLSQGQMRTQNLGEAWSGGGAGRGRGAAGTPAATPAAPSPAPRGTGAAPAAGRGAGPAGPRPTSTTAYVERPVTHRLENTGTALIRAVVIINETPGDDTTSEDAAGFAAKPELSNAWFRAYRVTLAPGEKTAPHRHRAPVAIVQATAGTGVGAGAVTFEFNAPGQWAYFDGDATHELRNTGDGQLDLIEVEVRRK